MYDFIFKPFNEMTDEDYVHVGFKSGLEIHQQLLTDKKLFCRCPAGKYSREYDAEILRHMRPTLSELGEYDGTALMEFKTKKEIIYRIKRETVCTYEMDDTPPFLINDDALDKAIGMGILFNCSIIDELHIARKQYLDGSIPTGFQRTAIYALNGKIPYKDREINIIQMSIEEDSCREVSDIGHNRVYLTDRLGIPLIETVTGPDMKTPQEVADVGWLCSNLVRSSLNVRRGIGAAREDVNVSVIGGTRVEIKGVSKIGHIPLLTYHEAMRQWNLLRLREELKRRGITTETFEATVHDVTKLLKSPRYLPLKEAVDQGLGFRCVVLKGFKDLLHWQTQKNTYFSREISDRVRVVACLTTIPNIIHSDFKGETITSSEWQRIIKAVGATDDDTMVIVWGNNQDLTTAADEIIIRAKEATIGVPSETRQALSDGTNGFERILPGPDRMYPDTDLPPAKITNKRIKRIKATLPEQFWFREEWYKSLKIPPDTITLLAVSKFAGLFETVVKEWKINPVLASVALIQFPKRLKKRGYNLEYLTVDIMRDIFQAHKDGLLSKDGILWAMKESLKQGKFYPELLSHPLTSKELENTVNQFKDGSLKEKLRNVEKEYEVIMGKIMNEYRSRVEGSIVAEQVGFGNGMEVI